MLPTRRARKWPKRSDPQRYEAFSAGTNPDEVNAAARHALEQLGIDTQGLRSKSLDEFSNERFDYIITLCDKSTLECSTLPGAGEYIAWNFEDPVSSEQDNAFQRTLHEIHDRIKMFLLVNRKR